LEKRCVQCDKAQLSCDNLPCSSNEVCVQTTQTCDVCAKVICAVDPMAAPGAPSKPNVGAIAGGVVGGVAAIAILTFIVWKYCLKGKRRPYSEADFQEMDLQEQEKHVDNDFQSRRSARASTHTVASMASSVLTRASNIIQIAYIPGVTNRSGPGSPDLLVPPVPPIPAMSPSSNMSSPYSNADQHFFLPDFRDSMASHCTKPCSRQRRIHHVPPKRHRLSPPSSDHRPWKGRCRQRQVERFQPILDTRYGDTACSLDRSEALDQVAPRANARCHWS
jgi:hypothetical protein